MVEERLANIQEVETQESESPPPQQAIGSKRHSIVSLIFLQRGFRGYGGIWDVKVFFLLSSISKN